MRNNQFWGADQQSAISRYGYIQMATTQLERMMEKYEMGDIHLGPSERKDQSSKIQNSSFLNIENIVSDLPNSFMVVK